MVRPRRRIRLVTIPIVGLLAVALAGCTQAELQGYMPGDPGVTNNTGSIIDLWRNSWIVLLIVGGFALPWVIAAAALMLIGFALTRTRRSGE